MNRSPAIARWTRAGTTAVAFALGSLAVRGTPSDSLQASDERAVAWLAAEVERSLTGAPRGDRELAAAALAIRALATRDREHAMSLRERLGAWQRPDGSFGASAASRPITWLAIGALHGSDRSADADRVSRARAWLAAPSNAAGDAAPAEAKPSDPVQRALGFLRTARTSPSASFETESFDLFTLAGGPFDLREAYATAIEPAASDGPRALATPAEDVLADPFHALAVSVAVLDHYRTSKEAALLAEASRPAAQIQSLLAAHRDAATGAWSATAGGAPSAIPTASALMVLETLARWERVQRQPGAPDPGDAAQGHRTAANDCEGCHASLQPAQVADWRASAHARALVGCAECHGTNHSKIFREAGKVPPAACGTCHAEAVAQFDRSKHARAEETLLRSALFAATTPAARASCLTCHAIGARQPDGTSGSCNHCHLAHGFAASDAREPEACALCHTGSDYPQDLAYRLSKHGALYAVTHDAERAPTCVTCHNPGGRHDDGFGISIGGSGIGAALAGTDAPFAAARLSSEEFAARRAEMVAVCVRCHSSRLAEASLREADELKREGEAHISEALGLLEDLRALGYFGDTPALELGPEHARPDPAATGGHALERFYEMWRFHHATAWKGAYHQSASISNHSSGIGTYDDLEQIRALAERWRSQRTRK